MVYILPSILLGIIGILVWYIIRLRQFKPDPIFANRREAGNPYFDLREMAILIKANQLGLEGIGLDEVYGVVSEINMSSGALSVVTYLTGDASIYLSSGGGFIGAGKHESVKKMAIELVKFSQRYMIKTESVERVLLPEKGQVNFNFLTERGIYYASDSLKSLEAGTSSFSPFFDQLNAVISEIRSYKQ